jgi:glycosyltransferase involved in cell wall biosynthesis
MRVLVFEQWRGGHYDNYLECLVPRLHELVDEVVLAVSRARVERENVDSTLAAMARLPRVRVLADVPPADPGLPAGQRWQLLKNLQRSVSETRPDYLMVPSADSQNLALAALGSLGVSAFPRDLQTEATFHCGYLTPAKTRRQAAKEFVYRLTHRGSTWTHLNFVNAFYLEQAISARRGWVGRAQIVADPIPRTRRLDAPAARRLLGIPEDGRYLGFLGGLDQRKAVPELLAAFRTASLGAKDRLLLGGLLDESFRRLIHDHYQDLIAAGRLVLIDRYLSTDELLRGFGALDVVCAVYRDFPGLSSLMLKGLAAGRPVIAGDMGWPGQLVERFGIGHTVNIHRREEFAATLAVALESSGNYAETEAVRRLLQFHDPSNFAAGMTERLRTLTGKPKVREVATWEWVTEALELPSSHEFGAVGLP